MGDTACCTAPLIYYCLSDNFFIKENVYVCMYVSRACLDLYLRNIYTALYSVYVDFVLSSSDILAIKVFSDREILTDLTSNCKRGPAPRKHHCF
jgi:hypothetical protein